MPSALYAVGTCVRYVFECFAAILFISRGHCVPFAGPQEASFLVKVRLFSGSAIHHENPGTFGVYRCVIPWRLAPER